MGYGLGLGLHLACSSRRRSSMRSFCCVRCAIVSPQPSSRRACAPRSCASSDLVRVRVRARARLGARVRVRVGARVGVRANPKLGLILALASSDLFASLSVDSSASWVGPGPRLGVGVGVRGRGRG